jgi:pimeloyl-ACP methyl ester carboxylesterase
MIAAYALRTAVALLIAAHSVSVALTAVSASPSPADPRVVESVVQTRQIINIRGHEQVLRLCGMRGGTPVIVSSGDGGWIHLGPHVAEVLSARGFFVVGFDAKAYLESFTNGSTTLRAEDEPGDYRTLIDFAARETGQKPILIGVSEGAGLSVLAATDRVNKDAIAGVIGLGLSDLTELGWRWRDMVIYLTHGTPSEPTFSVKAVVDRMAPVPFAAIHSTRDEYAPLAEVRQVMEQAREPKRLWIVDAANHRFSDNVAELDRVLFEAIAWTTVSRAGIAK